MAKSVINKFNRGEVSPLALARDDVTKIENSCELMDNFLPMRLGPMQFRPGFEYIGDAAWDSLLYDRALIPLTRSIGDSVVFEFWHYYGRILRDGLPVKTVTSTGSVTNPNFKDGGGSLTGWTYSGGVTYSGGARIPFGDYISQTITIPSANVTQGLYFQTKETWSRIRIGNGSTVAASDLIDRRVAPGYHYIEFTPTTTTYTITVSSAADEVGDGEGVLYLRSVGETSGGDVIIYGSGTSAVGSLDSSYDTTGDALFLSQGKDDPPLVVKRVGDTDWSSEIYIPLNGPFKTLNGSSITMTTSSATLGEVDLTASNDFFDYSKHINSPFKVAFPDVVTKETFSSTTATPTNTIKIKGYDDDREIIITITGSGSGVLELQRKTESGTWETVRSYDASGVDIYVDGYDSKSKEYGFICSSLSSGSFTVEMAYVSSAAYGNGILNSIPGSTTATVNLHNSTLYPSKSTLYWYPGAWGPGSYPQGVTIYEGRVVWVSKNRVDMTVTDDYYNFDEYAPGASAAISRTIGFGPTDDIAWVESASRLFIGLPTTEVLIRSNNFDEPLTNLNTNLKPGKGSGSAAVRPAVVDDIIYFAARDGRRIYSLGYDPGSDSQLTSDQMMMHPTICEDGIKSIVVTKHPEYRLWVLTKTGELRVLLKEPTENVQAWSRIKIDGTIEAITVVPNTDEDELWVIIRRNNSSKIAKLSSFYSIAPLDMHKRYTSPGTATLTGLNHLEGETVGVWADSQDRGDYTVSSGQITIDSASYTDIVVGLRYTADYKSNKLSNYIAESVIGERKTVSNTALVMKDYAPGALKVGRDFSHLNDLPGATTGALITDYDEQPFGFNGASDTDSRICMRATGPCTIMALSYTVNVEEKKSNG